MDTNRTLINRSAVRDFTLAVLAAKRPQLAKQMTRIGSPWFDKMEGWMRAHIERAIEDIPSCGKTIR